MIKLSQINNMKKDCGCNKKSVNEDWSEKYKRSIDCNNPKGFSQKAHCQGRKKNELVEEALTLFLEKNCPTDPSKWSYYKSQAKSKFDVYPSAYANGWASKQYKDAGGGWKKCDEGMANGLCEDCWDGYKQVGMKNKGGKQVPNCVPENVVTEGRGIKTIQNDLSKVVDAIQKELEKYKQTKGTPQEKTHIGNLKTLNTQKNKLTSELDNVVSGMYKDVELKAED